MRSKSSSPISQVWCISRSLFLVVLFVLLASLDNTAFAKKPSKKVTKKSKNTDITLQRIFHGDTWNNNSLFYDSANQKLVVRGKIKKIPAFIQDSKLKVVISGFDITTLQGSQFTVIRTGGGSAKYVRARFFAKIPAPSMLPWPITDLVVELVYKPTNQVLSRERISLYDLRARTATATGDPTPPVDGLVAQLTNRGLGDLSPAQDDVAGLEVPLLGSLPNPSLPDFNSRLIQAAEDLNTLNLPEDIEACISLTDDALTEDRFRNPLQFPAYAEALAQAETLYLTYLAIQEGSTTCAAAFGVGALICQLGIEHYCVKNPPTPGDFELCVNKIGGNATSLTIGSVSDLKMKFLDSNSNTSALIDADLELSGIDGLVNGRLSNLSVRWADSDCVPRPEAQLDNQEIFDRAWLREWATCEDLEIGSARATTGANPAHSSRFQVQASSTNAEDLYVTDSRGATFTFQLPYADSAKQTCALDFINDDAVNMLNLFYTPLNNVLNTTWNEGFPRSRTAQSVDGVLRPFTLANAPFTNHRFTARISQVNSTLTGGMRVTWTNVVEPAKESDFRKLNRTIFGQGDTVALSTDEPTDHLGGLFDGAFTSYLTLLNRVLWARSVTDQLSGPLTFTWGELAALLGTVRPPFTSPVSPAKITGEILETVHPAFGQFKSQTLEIVVQRTLDPIVYMPEDPSQAIQEVGFPLFYGVNGLKVIFQTDDDKPKEILSVNFVGYDDSFLLHFDPTVGSSFLDADMGNPRFLFQVDDSALTKCPMFSNEQGVGQSNACERELEEALFHFLNDKITAKLADIISEVPAPQFFTLNTAGSQDLYAEDSSRLQAPGYVQLFGNYLAVP